jgi:hypothetical protein
MASRLVRTNAVTVNDVLDGHERLEIDCADRVYLTLSVPNLVVGGQVVNFLTEHERNPIPSPALLERRGQAFRRAVASFAEANDIPVARATVRQPLPGRPGAAPLHLEPGHLLNATAASAAEANNCRRADLAVIHPRCCHSRPASESPAITTSPNGMER